MANTPPTITPPPAGPQRGDRATFAGRVDAFITWLIAAVLEFGALATNVYANALEAFNSATAAGTSASSAAASAAAAASSSGASVWVSGATYTQGLSVWSPINFQTYRRKGTGSGTTDPSLDSANWASLARSSRFDPIAMSALDMNLALGDSFTKTISTSSTFTFSNIPAGGSSWMLKLKLDGGSAAFPASVRPVNGAVPTMSTGKTHRILFVTEDGGATVAMVVAPNFAN